MKSILTILILLSSLLSGKSIIDSNLKIGDEINLPGGGRAILEEDNIVFKKVSLDSWVYNELKDNYIYIVENISNLLYFKSRKSNKLHFQNIYFIEFSIYNHNNKLWEVFRIDKKTNNEFFFTITYRKKFNNKIIRIKYVNTNETTYLFLKKKEEADWSLFSNNLYFL